jgi:hypothetical protein
MKIASVTGIRNKWNSSTLMLWVETLWKIAIFNKLNNWQNKSNQRRSNITFKNVLKILKTFILRMYYILLTFFWIEISFLQQIFTDDHYQWWTIQHERKTDMNKRVLA